MRLRHITFILASIGILAVSADVARADVEADAGPNQRVSERSQVTLDGSRSEADGDDGGPLTFFWEQTSGPTVQLSDQRVTTPNFQAPSVESNLNLRFRLTVTQGNDRSTDVTVVQVRDIDAQNRDPVAAIAPVNPVPGGTTVSLNGSESQDADGDVLTYQWQQTEGPSVTLQNANASIASFVAPQTSLIPIVLRFRLTVADGKGGQDATETQLAVIPSAVNQPPVANPGPNQVVALGSTVQLNGSGSTDPDGDPLAFSWRQVGGQKVTTSDPRQATLTFTIPQLNPGDFLTFRLNVSDGRGGQDEADVEVRLVPPGTNQPPVASAGADQTVTSGLLVLLSGAASSDPDNNPLAFSWTQVSGPAVQLTDPSQVGVRFQAPAATDAPVVLVFRLTVNDGLGGTATDDVAITVNPPTSTAPVAEAGENREIVGGGPVTLDGSGSTDPTGGPLTFAWEQIGGPVVTIENPTNAVATFTSPAVQARAEISFRLTVTGSGGQSSDTVTIAILPPAAAEPPQPQFSASISSLSIFPNPMDPQTGVTFEYVLGADSDVTITIYEMTGRLVAKLLAPRGSDGGLRGTSRWRWNGKNGDGFDVGNGGYVVQIRAVDAAGGTARLTDRLAVVR